MFPENLNTSRDEAEGNIEIRGKQNSLFPKEPVISDLSYSKSNGKITFEKRALITCNSNSALFPYDGGRGGLMVSALDSGASAPRSSPGRGHCVVFLGKTLHSHSAYLHPGV